MDRLYTRILKSSHISKDDKKRLATAIPVICDSVSEYFFEVSAKEYWDLQEFPMIVPVIQPFAFFDFLPPKQTTSVQSGVRTWGQRMEPAAWGIYMFTDDLLQLSLAERAKYSRKRLVALNKMVAEFTPGVYAAQQAGDRKRWDEEFERLSLFHNLAVTPLLFEQERLSKRMTEKEVARLRAAIRAKEAPRWEVEAVLWLDIGGIDRFNLREKRNNFNKLYRWEYSIWGDGHLYFPDIETWAQGISPLLKEVGGVDLTSEAFKVMHEDFIKYLNMVALGFACVHSGSGSLIPRYIAGQPQGGFELNLDQDKVRSAIGR